MDMTRLQDREEIRDLTYRYAEGWDRKDFNILVEVFTDDAVWDPSALGMPAAKGMEELRPLHEAFCAAMAGGSQHMQANRRITFDGEDTAHGYCYADAKARDSQGGEVQVVAIYEDTYQRVDARWRIASRTVKPQFPPKMGNLV